MRKRYCQRMINTAVSRTLKALLIPIVVATAFSACSARPQLLNSERIFQRYGSYGVEVLEQSATLRRASLNSTTNGTTTCRTYAVVQFENTSARGVADAHQAIVAGASLGATLAEAGWTINKETFYVGELEISGPQHPIGELMRLATPLSLGLHAYRLVLDNGTDKVRYASIAETHHPDYLNVRALLNLYPSKALLSPGDEAVAALEQLILRTH